MEKETGRTDVSYREIYPLGAAWTKRNWTKNISRSQVVCRCIFHLKCKYPNFIFFGKIKNNIQEFEGFMMSEILIVVKPALYN